MRSVISIILIVCAFFIVVEFVLACVSYKNREKIIAFFKRKKTWSIAGILMSIIALIPVGVILIYVIVTPILMMTRGDCFNAYHVSADGEQYISYNNELYIEFTDKEDTIKMFDEVNGDWSGGEGYVLDSSIKFPYIEYWILDIFIEEFKVSKDGQYMIIHTYDEQRTYRRAEE